MRLDPVTGRIAATAENVALEYPEGLRTESNASLMLTLSSAGNVLSGRVENPGRCVGDGHADRDVVGSRGAFANGGDGGLGRPVAVDERRPRQRRQGARDV